MHDSMLQLEVKGRFSDSHSVVCKRLHISTVRPQSASAKCFLLIQSSSSAGGRALGRMWRSTSLSVYMSICMRENVDVRLDVREGR